MLYYHTNLTQLASPGLLMQYNKGGATEDNNQNFARGSPTETFLILLQKVKALSEGGQQLNSKYDTDQGRVLIFLRVWIPCSIELRFKFTVSFYSNKTSLTTFHDP